MAGNGSCASGVSFTGDNKSSMEGVEKNWKRKRTANVGRQWHGAVGVVAVGRRGPGYRTAGGSNRATETAPMRCGGGNNAKETAPTRR